MSRKHIIPFMDMKHQERLDISHEHFSNHEIEIQDDEIFIIFGYGSSQVVCKPVALIKTEHTSSFFSGIPSRQQIAAFVEVHGEDRFNALMTMIDEIQDGYDGKVKTSKGMTDLRSLMVELGLIAEERKYSDDDKILAALGIKHCSGYASDPRRNIV